MIVVFVSECEKNALKKTRQILDCFAERIGSNTWKTRITMEGLKSVKLLLSKSATKQTSVACHRIVGYNSTELMWIVGNKAKFNSEGICPTNYTEIDHLQDFENEWYLLPYIKVVTALAGLFHDLGKASDCFQQKLKAKKIQADPFRHEYITCFLLRKFISGSKNDEDWLSNIKNNGFNVEIDSKDVSLIKKENLLKGMPPLASMIMWLILSHHRLPYMPEIKINFKNTPCEDIKQLMGFLSADFGYENTNTEIPDKECLTFSEGLPVNNLVWIKTVKRWVGKALELISNIKEIYTSTNLRVIMHYARLSLMLGDHYYSSKGRDKSWKTDSKLIANTKSKQFLDEHLVGVTEMALKIVHLLPNFETNMRSTNNTKKLRKRSSSYFNWQNKAVDSLDAWRKNQEKFDKLGFFALNMASTGCGKTLANAKIMRILSEDGDSLRYILALGLRNLTLQTGDAYREKIDLDNSELGVIIGSQAIKELYEKDSEKKEKEESDSAQDSGSESFDEIFPYDLDFEYNVDEDILKTIITNKKHLKLLNAPVIACTIDHLMSATESLRGGHHILPCLRLMSSDLVIDEIDDFSGNDLIAIGRLIYLAGMLGRKVMLSSATIPPDLAYGLFNAYQLGYKTYANSRNMECRIGCAFIDEYKTNVDTLSINEETSLSLMDYEEIHKAFVKNRCEKILKDIVLRKGVIAQLPDSKIEDIDKNYFESIKNNFLNLHVLNGEHNKSLDKTVSIGVIRFANIAPCAKLGRYLIEEAEYPEDTEVKVMVYHSSQILLMRHVQEKFLDSLLNRNVNKNIFENKCIKTDLAKLDSKIKHLIYIVVATPVEEVGRDHDFDWAIIEPSSFRSIIQMSGRVKRHRRVACGHNNIVVLQYNYKGYHNKCNGKCDKAVFIKPGYEFENVGSKLKLTTHDLNEIIDDKLLTEGINSIPRINKDNISIKDNSFIQIEHDSICEGVGDTKSKALIKPMGWYTGYWWLTGLAQVLTRFRDSVGTETLYLLPEAFYDSSNCKFYKKIEYYDNEDKKTKYRYDAVGNAFGIKDALPIINKNRVWYHRDYSRFLYEYSSDGGSVYKTAERFGFIDISLYPGEEAKANFEYSPELGLIKVKES